MVKKFRFSDTEIKKLELSATGFYYCSDTEVRGLRLRVGVRDKVFFLLKRVKRGPVREIRLGSFPVQTVSSVRSKVFELLKDFESGVDPGLLPNENVSSLTFGSCVDKYLMSKSGLLKPSTAEKFYRQSFKLHLSDWLALPVVDITPDIVEQKYMELTKNNSFRTTSVNVLFRSVRSVFNFIISSDICHSIKTNPVSRLSYLKLLKPSKSRDRLLLEHEIPVFVNYLLSTIEKYYLLPELTVTSEYLLFVLFTGGRRRECSQLQFADINATGGFLTFKATKTGQDRSVPLSSVLKLIIARRRSVSDSPFVFSSKRSRLGYVSEPKNMVTKMCKGTGLSSFCVHDLRRTFVTFGKFACPGEHIDYIVGHSVNSVSRKHYEKPTPLSLRPSMELVTYKLLALAGVSEPALAAVLMPQKPLQTGSLVDFSIDQVLSKLVTV